MCRALLASMFFLGACSSEGLPDVNLEPSKLKACYGEYPGGTVIVFGGPGAVDPLEDLYAYTPAHEGSEVEGRSGNDGSLSLLTTAALGEKVVLVITRWQGALTYSVNVTLTVENCN